ncbi:hypothetical protein PCE1_000295 [Barthelona sp. PCE]
MSLSNHPTCSRPSPPLTYPGPVLKLCGFNVSTYSSQDFRHCRKQEHSVGKLINSSSSEYSVLMEKPYRYNPPSDYEPDTTEDEVYTNESEKLKNDATLKAMQAQIIELQAQLNQQTAVVKVDLEPSAPNACDEPHQVSKLDGFIHIPTL